MQRACSTYEPICSGYWALQACRAARNACCCAGPKPCSTTQPLNTKIAASGRPPEAKVLEHREEELRERPATYLRTARRLPPTVNVCSIGDHHGVVNRSGAGSGRMGACAAGCAGRWAEAMSASDNRRLFTAGAANRREIPLTSVRRSLATDPCGTRRAAPSQRYRRGIANSRPPAGGAQPATVSDGHPF